MGLIASDQRRVIVGLGQTGLSVARHLARQGQSFAVVDSRVAPPGLEELSREMPAVPVHLGSFAADVLGSASTLYVSPGISLQEPAVAAALSAGIAASGDIDLFVEAASAPIVAITGSNGKSTVTTLVGAMASEAGRRVAVGGNLGIPALDLLDDAIDLYVLELSSFQLERCRRLNADVACLLNLSPDHLDRYPDRIAYHQAKQRIFRGARQVVVNRADPLSRPLLAQGMTEWSFGLDTPDLRAFGVGPTGMLMLGRDTLMPASELQIAGRHNLSNALAALAIGHAAGLPMESMLRALRRFQGLPHRCQRVARIDDVDYINDSKGTNVGATLAAIDGLCGDGRGRVVLIAGGDGKGADFTPLQSVLAQWGRAAVLIGRDAGRLAQCLEGVLPLHRADSMAEAVNIARNLAQPGDRVLLSPACASFDMFSHYMERGEVFAAAVRELTGGVTC